MIKKNVANVYFELQVTMPEATGSAVTPVSVTRATDTARDTTRAAMDSGEGVTV